MSDTPPRALHRVASQFGYALTNPAQLQIPTADVAAAHLCAAIVEATDLAGTDQRDLRRLLATAEPLAAATASSTLTAVTAAYQGVAAMLRRLAAGNALRQLQPGGRSTPATGRRWTPAVVRVAGTYGGPYPGQIRTDRTWNGWQIARFTRGTTLRLMQDLAEAPTSAGPLLSLHELSQTATLLSRSGDGDVTIPADQDGMFAIGAGLWCWDEWPPI